LTYTQKHFDGVDTIFDYATLTGACVTALGTAFAGIWSNDDHVAATVTDAALSTSAEKVWRMPWEEYTKELEHPVRFVLLRPSLDQLIAFVDSAGKPHFRDRIGLDCNILPIFTGM
jgi:hypothetical protein